MRQALVLANRGRGAEAVVHQSQPAGAVEYRNQPVGAVECRSRPGGVVVHRSRPVGAGVLRSPQQEVVHQAHRCSRIRVPARFQRIRPRPLHQRTLVEEEEEVEACRRAQEEVYRT